MDFIDRQAAKNRAKHMCPEEMEIILKHVPFLLIMNELERRNKNYEELCRIHSEATEIVKEA